MDIIIIYLKILHTMNIHLLNLNLLLKQHFLSLKKIFLYNIRKKQLEIKKVDLDILSFINKNKILIKNMIEEHNKKIELLNLLSKRVQITEQNYKLITKKFNLGNASNIELYYAEKDNKVAVRDNILNKIIRWPRPNFVWTRHDICKVSWRVPIYWEEVI